MKAIPETIIASNVEVMIVISVSMDFGATVEI